LGANQTKRLIKPSFAKRALWQTTMRSLYFAKQMSPQLAEHTLAQITEEARHHSDGDVPIARHRYWHILCYPMGMIRTGR
jgi:hypothetical protein